MMKDGKPLPGAQAQVELLPNENHWYGRFRAKANDSNNYLIDREAQRNGTIFSGITNIHIQDQAVTESMGPITDHEFEHLAPTDIMIARTRRHILATARAYAEQSAAPPCLDDPETYLTARSGFFVADPKTEWQDAYAENIANAVRPAMKHAAE